MLVFRPRLFEALREYDRAALLSDLADGIMVGVVALPLAFGFAIAWGVEPSRGLWTAFIAGVMLVVVGVPRNMENSLWTAGN